MNYRIIFILLLALIARPHAQFINELHYENAGRDQGEGVEIAAPPGTNLAHFHLLFYNGDGTIYRTQTLSGIIPSQNTANGVLAFSIPSIQNGPDAVALVDPDDEVLEFISYEGQITAVEGPAQGLVSVDIGVSQSSNTPVGHSLQRTGTGLVAGDFAWTGPLPSSFGEINAGQTMRAHALSDGQCSYVFMNEFHYENVGRDANEAIEIVGPAGLDLSGWTLALYNGADGRLYRTLRLAGVFESQSLGWGTISFSISPIQSGARDGIALVDTQGNVLQFFSYEGTLTALDGPAAGIESVDIGIEECASTPATQSVQLVGTGNSSCNFTWAGPKTSSFGSINEGQTFVPRGASASTKPSTDPPSSTSSSTAPTTPPEPVIPQNALQTTIQAVQGASHKSPLEGRIVNVQGIVTAVASNGYYLQDPIGDGDIATSDAIFIHTSRKPPVQVAEKVSVTGTVEERVETSRTPNLLSRTQITKPISEVISTDNPLPTPVVLGSSGRRVPSESIDDSPDTFDPENDALDLYESLEGMRVRLPRPAVISSKHKRTGEIWVLVDGGDDATGMGPRGTLTVSEGDFNPERIQVDDNRRILSRFSAPEVVVGDSLSDVTGVMNYASGNYEVISTEPYTHTSGGLEKEVSKLEKSQESLLIASVNAYNVDPSDVGQMSALADVVVNRLNVPDVIGLQEIQDNDGPTRSGVTSADKTLQLLIDAISEAGGPEYTYLDNTFIGENTSGGQRFGNIRCAFIFLKSRVQLLSFNTVVDAESQQRSRSNPFYASRLPLVAHFKSRQTGDEFTVVNVHLSSKGGSSPVFGQLQPFEDLQADKRANGNVDNRVKQANAIKKYLDESALSNVIILGDFNDYQFNPPLTLFIPDYVILTNHLQPTERYSYIFEGQAQQLDHIIVSQNLKEAQFDVVHCNAEFKHDDRASDHDPILAKISF